MYFITLMQITNIIQYIKVYYKLRKIYNASNYIYPLIRYKI